MVNVTFRSSEDLHNLAKKVYERQEERILRVLYFADIQHIGSTSILASITKGDLDINVRISLKDFNKSVEELKKMYEINQPENWTGTFASFKDDTSFELPVGVQLTVIGSKYDDFVKLRDLLLNDPKLLEEYNKMKEKYEGESMDEYRKEKAEFFERLRKHLNDMNH